MEKNNSLSSGYSFSSWDENDDYFRGFTMQGVTGQMYKKFLNTSLGIILFLTSCGNEGNSFGFVDKDCARQFKHSIENGTIEIIRFERYDYENYSYIDVDFYSIEDKTTLSTIFEYSNDMFLTSYPEEKQFIEKDCKDHYDRFLYAKENGKSTIYDKEQIDKLFSYS